MGMGDGWRDLAHLDESGATTDRVLFFWSSLEPSGPDSFQPDFYLPSREKMQQEVDNGQQIVGVIQFTPPWAARNPELGERSVPSGLGDPNGPWSSFVRRLVNHYKGQVKHWTFWNEMEFRPNDIGAGGATTWAGTEAEYWQLLKDGYRAVKSADADATVIFGATSYWVDVANNREPYVERVLRVAELDPEARPNGWFFDVIAMNIYRAPDDVYRIFFELDAILASHGIDKPMWITEHNCMPFNDPATPKPDDAQRCTLDEQSAYLIQSYAMAFAAGWERVLWYQLTDSEIWQTQEVWGLIRDDGSKRPAFEAYKVFAHLLAKAERFTFKPLSRETSNWSAWPTDQDSYYPNWQVYQVVADGGGTRVNIVWNGDGAPLRARVRRDGASAIKVDKTGNQTPLEAVDGWYVVDLGPASAHGPADPNGYFYVGGDPVMIVQSGVPDSAPISKPALGDPGSQPSEFRVFVTPEGGQKVVGGESASFQLDIRGYEGFGDQIAIALQSYSTQRDPGLLDALPPSISLSAPGTALPDETVAVQVHTTAEIAPGIHFITLQLEGGGVTRSVDLVVQVD